jgi:hypothetical protein
MAQAFERSTFAGFDLRQSSIQSATQPQPRPVSETQPLLREAGFSHMRRATENPFTIIPEAEP